MPGKPLSERAWNGMHVECRFPTYRCYYRQSSRRSKPVMQVTTAQLMWGMKVVRTYLASVAMYEYRPGKFLAPPDEKTWKAEPRGRCKGVVLGK